MLSTAVQHGTQCHGLSCSQCVAAMVGQAWHAVTTSFGTKGQLEALQSKGSLPKPGMLSSHPSTAAGCRMLGPNGAHTVRWVCHVLVQDNELDIQFTQLLLDNPGAGGWQIQAHQGALHQHRLGKKSYPKCVVVACTGCGLLQPPSRLLQGATMNSGALSEYTQIESSLAGHRCTAFRVVACACPQ